LHFHQWLAPSAALKKRRLIPFHRSGIAQRSGFHRIGIKRTSLVHRAGGTVTISSLNERRCSIGKLIHKGTLILDSSGCFCLRKPGNTDPRLDILLTSSHSLDIKLGNRWIKGRVEYTQVGGGYYFFSGSNWCPLAEGMEVRYIED
jgi:hypothetical protein